MKKSIVLIGMPGAGKSTVGVVLAKNMGLRFVDSDLVIQEKYGKLLYEIIEENGLDGFLQIESKVNTEIDSDASVIATGGSAVYAEEAMKHFKESGTVIYLQLSYESVWKRLGDLQQRGVIFKEHQTLQDIYEERVSLYEKYADIIIECENKSIREIVAEIAEIGRKS